MQRVLVINFRPTASMRWVSLYSFCLGYGKAMRLTALAETGSLDPTPFPKRIRIQNAGFYMQNSNFQGGYIREPPDGRDIASLFRIHTLHSPNKYKSSPSIIHPF